MQFLRVHESMEEAAPIREQEVICKWSEDIRHSD